MTTVAILKDALIFGAIVFVTTFILCWVSYMILFNKKETWVLVHNDGTRSQLMKRGEAMHRMKMDRFDTVLCIEKVKGWFKRRVYYTGEESKVKVVQKNIVCGGDVCGGDLYK